jgi:predicted dehydrogenase
MESDPRIESTVATRTHGSAGTYDVGVVGAGRIASTAHLPILHNIDRVRIKYVADIDGTRARRMGRSYGAKGIETDDAAALPECDVALLAVPVTVREPYVAEFGRRGTAVFSEKPFALNPEEHRRFLAHLDDVSCNYLRLCFGSTRRAREVVEAGVFGAVERVVCREGGIVGPTGLSSSGFGADERLRDRYMLLDRSCHGLSQILYAFPGGELSVEASAMEWQRGFDVDLRAELSLSYGGREVPVEFELTRVRPVETAFRIEFEHAVVEFSTGKPDARLSVTGTGEGGSSLAFDPHPDAASTFAQAAYLRWMGFLDSLAGERAETIGTAPEITELMTDMYDLATDSRGGE